MFIPSKTRQSLERECALCLKIFFGKSVSRYCSDDCWMKAQLVQAHCMKLVNKMVSKGLLARAKDLQCEDCGQNAQVYDHRDYTRPLDVVPLCKSCNYKRPPANFKGVM